jgi:hypothetical protein
MAALVAMATADKRQVQQALKGLTTGKQRAFAQLRNAENKKAVCRR